jgi:hypothetical protein
MKISKTTRKRSLIQRPQIYASHEEAESFFTKFLYAHPLNVLSKHNDTNRSPLGEPDGPSYDLVTVSSYAQATNKTIAQAARDVMELINDDPEKACADKPLNWTQLYQSVKEFIASPTPLNVPHDIYREPGDTCSERDLLESMLRTHYERHLFSLRNLDRPMLFEIEMID